MTWLVFGWLREVLLTLLHFIWWVRLRKSVTSAPRRIRRHRMIWGCGGAEDAATSTNTIRMAPNAPNVITRCRSIQQTLGEEITCTVDVY